MGIIDELDKLIHPNHHASRIGFGETALPESEQADHEDSQEAGALRYDNDEDGPPGHVTQAAPLIRELTVDTPSDELFPRTEQFAIGDGEPHQLVGRDPFRRRVTLWAPTANVGPIWVSRDPQEKNASMGVPIIAGATPLTFDTRAPLTFRADSSIVVVANLYIVEEKWHERPPQHR